MASPIAFFVVVAGALFGTVFMVLVFLPPSAYLRMIARRAQQQAASS